MPRFKPWSMPSAAKCGALGAAILAILSVAAFASGQPRAPFSYSANTVVRDSESGTVALIGHAEILLKGDLDASRALRFSADRVVRDRTAERVELIGHAEVDVGRERITGPRIVLADLATGDKRLSADNLKIEGLTGPSLAP